MLQALSFLAVHIEDGRCRQEVRRHAHPYPSTPFCGSQGTRRSPGCPSSARHTPDLWVGPLVLAECRNMKVATVVGEFCLSRAARIGAGRPVVLAPVSQSLRDQGRRDDVAARAAQFGGDRRSVRSPRRTLGRPRAL